MTAAPATAPDVLTLRWECARCGWTVTLDAPGFPGNGWEHFIHGQDPCGPLTARRVRPQIARGADSELREALHVAADTLYELVKARPR